jgi:hypothetical protein
MAKKKEDLGGVWRTVGGRRIFIKDGQDLYEAMNDSGKFTNLKKTNSQRAKGYSGKVRTMDEYIDDHNKKIEEESEYLNKRRKEIEFEQKKGIYTGARETNADGTYKHQKEMETGDVIASFRNADNWKDINSVVDNIKDERLKAMMKKETKTLEDNENDPWKSGDYLAKQYIFYKEDFERGSIEKGTTYSEWKKGVVDDRNSNVKSEWQDIPGFKDYEYNQKTDEIRTKKEANDRWNAKKIDDFVKNNPDWENGRYDEDEFEDLADTLGVGRSNVQEEIYNRIREKTPKNIKDYASKAIEEQNRKDRLEKDKRVAEDYKKIYQKAQAEYEKYRDENSGKYSNWDSPEYKEMSEKREQLRVKAQETKVNALTHFNKTIPYDEMFDVAKQISGSKNIEFGKPEVVVKNGEVYTKYSSNDIKQDAGIFGSVLKNVKLEEFNSQLYIDKNGEFAYWGSMDLRYEHNDGGTNGMKLIDYRYNNKTGWDITGSDGYKYQNGKRIDSVSELADYYVKHYGETRADAVAMAEARLKDLKKRESGNWNY